MKLIYTALLIGSFALAEEIKIGNTYFKEYINPFMSIFKEAKQGDVNIQVKDEMLKLKVKSNQDSGNYLHNINNSYEFDKKSMKNTIANMLQEQYNITPSGTNILVDIDNINVYIDYQELNSAQSLTNSNSLISSIEVSADYTINVEGKEVYKKTFKLSTLDDTNKFDRYIGILTMDELGGNSTDIQEVVGGFIERNIYISLLEAKEQLKLNIKK